MIERGWSAKEFGDALEFVMEQMFARRFPAVLDSRCAAEMLNYVRTSRAQWQVRAGVQECRNVVVQSRTGVAEGRRGERFLLSASP